MTDNNAESNASNPSNVLGNVIRKIKRCPNCGSMLIALRKKSGGKKYKYECEGCWTETKWCWSIMEARDEWNSLKKEEVEDDSD